MKRPVLELTDYETNFFEQHGKHCPSARHKRRRYYSSLKRWLARAVDYTCEDCRRTWSTQKEALANTSVHHVVPVSKGGSDEISNLRFLCDRCHQKQHDFELPYIKRKKS